MLKKILILVSALFIFATMAIAQAISTGTSTTTPSAAKSKRPPIFRPNKDQIKQVQTILIENKLYAGETTGKYNLDTRAGIKSFQKDAGLRETGTLNRATLEKFGVQLTDRQKAIPVTQSSLTPVTKNGRKPKSAQTAATSDTPKKRTIFRATIEQIKAAQNLLKSKSMYSGEETGKLDDATRESLKKFQEANGVKVTGTLNASTLDKMGIPLTDKQKSDAAGATSPN